jgi:hypothetical protein
MLPLPTSLSIEISPSINSARLLQIERPSPEPPNLREIEASAWVKD